MSPDELTPSGRRLEGPAADLVELHRDGHVWTAIEYREPWRRPDVVEAALQARGAFLRNPTVAGVVDLDAWWPEQSRLVYPTGRVWSLAELLLRARQAGARLGLRAGLELAYVGGALLESAAELGLEADADVHGNPSPWRWMLDDDGDLELIGWGIPALELYAHDADPETMLPTDSYRYCAPERLRGDDEDTSTDLFTLALIVAEAIIGEPLYDGTTVEVRHVAERADVERRLYQHRDDMSEDVRAFLGTALDPYRDGRHHDAEDFVTEAHDLLYGPLGGEGPGLADCVERFGLKGPRLPPIPQPGRPKWANPEGDRTDNLRWSKVRRDRGHGGPEPAAPTADGKALGARKDRGARAQSPADVAAGRLGSSQRRRDADLRERVEGSGRRPVRVLDRNGLFPRRPVADDSPRFLVHLPGEHTTWIRLDPGETLAASAARVADKACPTPFDTVGRLTGWYRLVQGDRAWFGDSLTSVLDPEADATLEFVENRVINARLIVNGHRDEPVEIDVGTAVHAQFLVSNLRQRFDLRARDWALWVEADRPLDRWQILDDHDPDDGLELHLRRTRRKRRTVRRA